MITFISRKRWIKISAHRRRKGTLSVITEWTFLVCFVDILLWNLIVPLIVRPLGHFSFFI